MIMILCRGDLGHICQAHAYSWSSFEVPKLISLCEVDFCENAYMLLYL